MHLVKLHLGEIEATKSKEALILVSDHKMDASTISIYKKRWEIETMFGALKSKGFNFEESKLSHGYKVEKLMAFLSIAFVWSVLASDYKELDKPIVLKKEPYRIKSIFKYGLEWLKNVLLNVSLKKQEFAILIGLLKNAFFRRE